MKISIKIPRGYEEIFNKLKQEERDKIKEDLSEQIKVRLEAKK